MRCVSFSQVNKDTNDLLWLAIVGLTDQYIHQVGRMGGDHASTEIIVSAACCGSCRGHMIIVNHGIQIVFKNMLEIDSNLNKLYLVYCYSFIGPWR